MADSKREAALKALFTALSAIAGPEVRRNEPEAGGIPPGGLVNLSDGDLQAEPVLSPLSYDITHRASVLVLVQVADATARDSQFDAILVALAGAVDADPGLGGVVDFTACAVPEILDEPVEGSATIKAAIVPVVMEYNAPTALG
ncbi:acyl-CoA transferase [Thalassospira marina]|uniref:Acyl-CoA transferase n=1 Tax=Thalassospira marina TaxID=2048283 RepID=A0A2N3KV91_9PROT|nr:acyl-CoA transferase [Thalassospira marina]PKR54406.1 acyl-CoA transferase [Thalassospira marina]